MAVNERDRVVFHPVRLVRTEASGAWVAGLPGQARLITLGQGFVAEGQQVEPVDESAVQTTILAAGESRS